MVSLNVGSVSNKYCLFVQMIVLSEVIKLTDALVTDIIVYFTCKISIWLRQSPDYEQREITEFSKERRWRRKP